MFVKIEQPAHFWITNISKMDVSVGDLGITVRAGSSINLYNKRRYNFSQSELEKSLISGSLFAKREKLVRRVVPPIDPRNDLLIPRLELAKNTTALDRRRSMIQIQEVRFDEFEISDEQYMNETADLTDQYNPKK